MATTIVIEATGRIAHVKVGSGEEPYEKMMQVVRKLLGDGLNLFSPTRRQTRRIAHRPGLNRPVENRSREMS